MSRLLSQAEVDALLSSFGSEAEAAGTAHEVLFDLRAPLVLAGERLAAVQSACEKIAVTVAEALTVVLVTERPVQAEFAGLSQQPASTVLGTLASEEPLGLLLDENGEQVGGLAFQSEVALACVDRLQGGEGICRENPRPLSPVETRLFEGALGRLVRALDRTALAPVKSGGVDRDPVFGRLAQRGGMLVNVSMRLALPGGDGLCRLLLTPVLVNRLVVEDVVTRSGGAPPQLLDALRGAPVTIEPVITGASMRLSDLERMRPGHVLQLDVRENDPLALRFNGALLARGALRRQQGERLFEIREFVPHGTKDRG